MDKKIFKRFATGKYFHEGWANGNIHNAGIIKAVHIGKNEASIDIDDLNKTTYVISNDKIENANLLFDHEMGRWCICLHITDFIFLLIYANK